MNWMLVFASNMGRSCEVGSPSSSSEFAGSRSTRFIGSFAVRVFWVMLLLAELVSSVITELNSEVSTEDYTLSLSSAIVFPINSVSLMR
jgi:hypothetical protein